MVAEEAADGAVALALETADEVDRPEAVGAAVDEIADEPQDGIGAGPPLRGVDQAAPAGGATRVRLDGRGRRPRRTRVSPSLRDGGAGPGPLRLLDDATQRADELQRLAVGDEPLEQRELGLEPVGIDRRARDQVDLRMRARGRRLAVADELLVELLARRRPDELDRDVASRAPCPRAGSSCPPGRRCAPARPCRARRPARGRRSRRPGRSSCTASGIVMKKRVISGCVTVTGPPRAIWRRKIGITEPGRAEDVAEAHGDEPRRRRPPGGPRSRRSTRRAPSTGPSPSSGSRPCRSRRARTAWRRTRRRRRRPSRVPSVLLRTASIGFASISATCLYAAAWKTTPGRYLSKTWRSFAASLTSATTAAAAARNPRSRTSSRSISNSAGSAWSTQHELRRAADARSGGRARSRSSRRRPSRARPRPRRSPRSPSRSTSTGSRPSTSSTSTGRSCRARSRSPETSSERLGRVFTGTLERRARSRRSGPRSSPDAVGIAISTSSGRRSRRMWARSAVVPSTRTPWSRRFRLRGSSSSEPDRRVAERRVALHLLDDELRRIAGADDDRRPSRARRCGRAAGARSASARAGASRRRTRGRAAGR